MNDKNPGGNKKLGSRETIKNRVHCIILQHYWYRLMHELLVQRLPSQKDSENHYFLFHFFKLYRSRSSLSTPIRLLVSLCSWCAHYALNIFSQYFYIIFFTITDRCSKGKKQIWTINKNKPIPFQYVRNKRPDCWFQWIS